MQTFFITVKEFTQGGGWEEGGFGPCLMKMADLNFPADEIIH